MDPIYDDPNFKSMPKEVQDILRAYDEKASKQSREDPMTNVELTRWVFSANATFIAMTETLVSQSHKIHALEAGMSVFFEYIGREKALDILDKAVKNRHSN